MAENSKYLYNSAYPTLPFTLYVWADDDGSTVDGVARLTASKASFAEYSNRYLNLYIDGSLVASLAVSSLSTYQSVEVSGSLDCDDGNVTVTAEWTGSKATYCPEGGSVSCSVNVSTNYKSSLSFPSNSTLGEGMSVNISGKSGNTHSIQGRVENSGWITIASGLGIGAHTITPSLSAFEPYMSSKTSDTFYLRLNTNGVGSNDYSMTMKVPDTYVPTISLSDIVYHNDQNGYLIAGQSYFDIEFDTDVYPSDNSATISKVEVSSAGFTPASIGTPSLTINSAMNKATSAILPEAVDVSTYVMYVVLTATDSRGRTASLNVPADTIGTIFGYVPPAISNFEIFRSDSSGTEKPSGTYAYVSVDIDSDTELTIAKVNINNIDYPLSLNSGGYYEAVIGRGTLVINTQYTAVITVQNKQMETFGDTVQVVATLPTMQMPISLYDDSSQMSASIGEMARYYSDCPSDADVFNLSAKAYFRSEDDSGNVYIKKAIELIKGSCPFPVGAILPTIDSTNPGTIWGGTTWSQVAQGRMLIGVGTGTDANNTSKTFNVNDTGGEYTHKLTVSEMPAHTHSYTYKSEEQTCDEDANTHSVGSNNERSGTTGSTGGNGYHENTPPYFAVYLWERTA